MNDTEKLWEQFNTAIVWRQPQVEQSFQLSVISNNFPTMSANVILRKHVYYCVTYKTKNDRVKSQSSFNS